MADGDLTREPHGRRSQLPAGSKVLITGISGFVGGRLAERLVEQQIEVRGAVRSPERAGRARQMPVQLIRVNLGSAKDVARAVDGVDYVFHCAYDVRSRQQNIHGLRNLIESCTRARTRCLVHVSSFAVYEPFPDGLLTEQTRDGDRSNPYVNTKLDLETMIFDAARNHHLSATVIQPTVVYGPFCPPWTNTPAEQLSSGHVVLPDEGEGLCNAVYIDDLVDALVLAANNPAAIGKRFIISGPETITWKEFFSEIAKTIGADPPEFWSLERILQAQSRTTSRARLALSSPRHLLDMVTQSQMPRTILKAVLPHFLQMRMKKSISASNSRRHSNEYFVPNQQKLAFYRSRAAVTSDRARADLGYQPRFDFQRGMKQTCGYLKSTYGGRGSVEHIAPAAASRTAS